MARYNQFWYNAWRSMMNRCYNKNSANYKYYGVTHYITGEIDAFRDILYWLDGIKKKYGVD